MESQKLATGLSKLRYLSLSESLPCDYRMVSAYGFPSVISGTDAVSLGNNTKKYCPSKDHG